MSLESGVNDSPSGCFCCFESYEDAVKSAWGVFCCGLLIFLTGSILTGVFTGTTSDGAIGGLIIGLLIAFSGLFCCYLIYAQIQKRKVFPQPMRLIFLCEDAPIPPQGSVPGSTGQMGSPQVVLYTAGTQTQPQQPMMQMQQPMMQMQQPMMQMQQPMMQMQQPMQMQQHVQNTGQQQFVIKATAPAMYDDDNY